jgi:hypothetical protein
MWAASLRNEPIWVWHLQPQVLTTALRILMGQSTLYHLPLTMTRLEELFKWHYRRGVFSQTVWVMSFLTKSASEYWRRTRNQLTARTGRSTTGRAVSLFANITKKNIPCHSKCFKLIFYSKGFWNTDFEVEAAEVDEGDLKTGSREERDQDCPRN